jgi:hypothetical protein
MTDQRGPVLLQTAAIGDASPRASVKACDRVGPSAPKTASHTTSHTAQGRYGCALNSFADIKGAQGLGQVLSGAA